MKVVELLERLNLQIPKLEIWESLGQQESKLKAWIHRKAGIFLGYDSSQLIKITYNDLKLPILIAFLKVVLISYLFYNNLFFSILLIPYIVIYIRNQKTEIRSRKTRTLNNQFKDGMMAVSFALNVGYSIENSFSEAVEELILLYGEDSLIVTEFNNINRRIKRNENFEVVMEQFAESSGSEDIKYFSQVFRYARRSGGDMISIIKNTVTTISQKIEVENEVQTIISGKKMEQKIMEYIPFAIVLYLKISSPEFIGPLYGNLIGIVSMTVCVGIYFVACYWARRIVNIEI